MKLKSIMREITPPAFWTAGKAAKKAILSKRPNRGLNDPSRPFDPTGKTQELGVYWSEEMARQLETWGAGNTWDEIQCLMMGRSGRTLDVACGTGVNMIDLAAYPDLDVWGIDISDFLLEKAKAKGLRSDRLFVGDATKMPFEDKFFDYSYSIGSFEHFTEEGIDAVIGECARVTSRCSFHNMPVSETDINEGWVQANQSFWVMSKKWWVDRFAKYFDKVVVMGSLWHDPGLAKGAWFCGMHTH